MCQTTFKAVFWTSQKVFHVREAIPILQGEMQGYYTNTRREDYGLDVKSPDFRVEGLGEFQNMTHVEVKNPVKSTIKITNDKYC